MYYCLPNSSDMGISTVTSSPRMIVPNGIQHSEEDDDEDDEEEMEVDGRGPIIGSLNDGDKVETVAKILLDICLATTKSKCHEIDGENNASSPPFNSAVFIALAKDYDFKNYKDKETGCSLLHHAITTRHQSVFNFLIEIGADVNVPNRNFLNTPLHIACLLPSPLPWISKLIMYGSRVDIVNHRHQTPLHVLLCNPQISSSNQLLQCMDTLLLLPNQNPTEKIESRYHYNRGQDVKRLRNPPTLEHLVQSESVKNTNISEENLAFRQKFKNEQHCMYDGDVFSKNDRVNHLLASNEHSTEHSNSTQELDEYSILRKSLSPPNEFNYEDPFLERKCHGNKNCPNPSICQHIKEKGQINEQSVVELRSQILSTKDSYARLTPILCAKFALFRRDFRVAYAIAHKILPLGACPNEQDKDGRTLLSYSVTYLDDSINLTRLLVNFGARVYVTNLLYIPTDNYSNSVVKNQGVDDYSRYHLRSGHHLLGTNDKLFGDNFYPLDFEVEDGCKSQLVFGEFKIWKEFDGGDGNEDLHTNPIPSCRFQAASFGRSLSLLRVANGSNVTPKHFDRRNNVIFKRKHTIERQSQDMPNDGVNKNGLDGSGKGYNKNNNVKYASCYVKCYREICALCKTYCLVPLGNNHRRKRKIDNGEIVSKPWISSSNPNLIDATTTPIMHRKDKSRSGSIESELSYKIVRVDDDQNCFNWFLKAVISRRKLENYRKTLVILAGTMGQDPIRMRTGVIRSMFIHLQCFRVLGPLFLRIKNLLAPFWSQPRPLKYLASLALRNANIKGGRCPHDFPGHLEGGSPTLPKSLQRYLLFLEEEESDKMDLELSHYYHEVEISPQVI